MPKRNAGFAHVIILVVVLIVLAAGAVFVLSNKNIKNLLPFSSPSPSPLIQVDKDAEKVALEYAAQLNREIYNRQYTTYSENGMSFLIPSDWEASKTEAPKGQIFSPSDRSIIVAVHTDGKDCFKTLQEFLDGIQKQGGYDITSTETMVDGVTTYVVKAKLNAPDGTALPVTSYLYKGSINNYEFSVIDTTGLPETQLLTGKLIGSVKIADVTTTTKAVACK